MNPKFKSFTTLFILTTVLVVSLATQVRSTGIATGSYYLDTPLPLATFYVGEYSNGTYYVVNGSNWQNFLRTTNASYLTEMCVGNMSNGGKIRYGIGSFNFPTTVTIDKQGVYIEGEVVAYQIYGTVFNFTGTNAPLFKFTHADTHCFFGGISNAELRGNDGAGTKAIHVDQFWSDLYFEKLFVRDFADAGIQVDGGASGNAANIVSKTWNIWIKNCLIEENHAGLGYGVYLTDTDSRNHSISRVTVEGGHFYDNNHSVYSDSSWIFNCEFSGFKCDQSQQESIYLLGMRRASFSELKIFDSGTDALNTYSAIYVANESLSYPIDLNFFGNTIGSHWNQNQTKYCLEFQGSVDHVVLAGNVYDNWKSTAPLGSDPWLWNSTETDIIVDPDFGSTRPTVPVEGQMFYDTDDHALFIWNSTHWVNYEEGGVGSSHQPQQDYSYLVYSSGGIYYMKNGSTEEIDYSSSNFNSVIESALGNLTSGRTWQEVIKLKGNFSIGTTVRLYASDANVLLDCRNAEFHLTASAIMFDIQPTSQTMMNVTILGGHYIGNGASSLNCIRLYRATHCTLDGLNIENFDASAGGVIYSGTYACNNTIQNCWIHDNTGNDGIQFANTPNDYNIVRNCRIERGKTGILVSSNTNGHCIFEGNFIADWLGGAGNHGMYIDNDAGGNIISNCQFYNAPSGGNSILIKSPNNIISNCIFDQVIGVSIVSELSSYTANDNTVTGCTFIDVIAWGIKFGHDYMLNSTLRNKAFGCNFIRSTTAIVLNADTASATSWTNYTTVSYCNFYDCTTAFNNHEYPSHIGHTTVEHCGFYSVTTKFSNLGSAIDLFIRWNEGYKTEYSGSATNATTTTWTFTSGLDVTPTRIYASFNETGITSYAWSYSAGTITITSGVTIPDFTICYCTAYSWDE